MSGRRITARSIIIGLLGMVLITSSSMFMALKIGTMPWPILFATILSLTLIGKRRGSTLEEVNLTETIMASGAMVSAGLVFTIPGIWMIDPEASVPFLPVLAMALSGVLLGLVFSSLYRKKLIVEDNLVFPLGNAAYETMTTGISGGKESRRLLVSIGGSAVFASLRDFLHLFPSRLVVFSGSAIMEPISFWLSPMALSIGAMINHLSSFLWLGGALAAYLVFTPLTMALGLFPSLAACEEVRKNIGIGIVIGTGIGVFLKAIYGIVKKNLRKGASSSREGLDVEKKDLVLYLLVIALVVAVLSLFTPISFPGAIVAVVGAGLTVLLSGMLTGECGTNPLEVFGILVMILSSVLFKGGRMELFLTAGVVSTACGLTGVLMNDYKCGHQLGTDVKAQLAAEAIGGLSAALLATAMVFVIKRSVGVFGTSEYPAPQAAAVASLIEGGGENLSLLWGIGIGIVLYLLRLPSATLGLGFYLPVHISLSMGVGAVLSLVLEKKNLLVKKDVNLLSSGFMGGEGIVGVLVAFLSIFR